MYCGKIFIPKHKDEESQFVKGQHETLISESLFYEVHDILDGRGRRYRAYHQQTVCNKDDRRQLTEQIKDLEGKLSKARDLLLSDHGQ